MTATPPKQRKLADKTSAVPNEIAAGELMLAGLGGGLLAAVLAPPFFKALACWQSDCSGSAGPEAAALGVFAAFVLGMVSACFRYLAAPGAKPVLAAGSAGAALVIGIIVSLSDSTFADKSLRIVGFLAFLLVALLIVPIALRPTGWSFQRLVACHARIFSAILAAIVMGTLVQVGGEILWTGFSGWGADKFVAAPSGTVIAGAAWGALLLEITDRDAFEGARDRRILWLAATLFAAALFSAGHGLLFMRDHLSEEDWAIRAGLASAGLTLPGIVASAVSLRMRGQALFWRNRGLAISLTVTILAAALAALLALDLLLDGVPIAGKERSWIAFSLSHGLAALAVVVSIAVGTHLFDRILARWGIALAR